MSLNPLNQPYSSSKDICTPLILPRHYDLNKSFIASRVFLLQDQLSLSTSHWSPFINLPRTYASAIGSGFSGHDFIKQRIGKTVWKSKTKHDRHVNWRRRQSRRRQTQMRRLLFNFHLFLTSNSIMLLANYSTVLFQHIIHCSFFPLFLKTVSLPLYFLCRLYLSALFFL